MNKYVPMSLAALLLVMGCADDDTTSPSSNGSPAGSSEQVDVATTPAPPTPSTEPTDSMSTAATASTDAAASTAATASTAGNDEPSSFSVNIGEPPSLDPAVTAEIEGAQVLRLIYEPLVTLDEELQVVSGVADTWSVAEDGVTWTFELDPDAAFADGRPVIAGDFAFAFARAADPDLASPSAYQGLPIEGWADVSDGEPSGAIGDVEVSGVTVVDDHTLTVRTVEPFGLLPKVLTYGLFAPVAREHVETEDAAAAYAEAPIGNGPYAIDGTWEHNDRIVLGRNPHFHGRPGVADRIEMKIYSEIATAFRDFEAGELDVVRGVPPEETGGARERFADRFIETPTASLYYLGFPTDVAPFDDPDLRKALSLAVDREAIVERILGGTQIAATGVVPPQAPGALTDPCDGCTYDPERAKELFAKGGGTPGMTIVLYDIADDGQAVLTPIVNSWKELFDIDVEIRSFEWAQFLEETSAGNAEGPFELGWVWDYPSGYSMLSPLFESTSDSNNLGWSDDRFDELMRQVRVAPDEASALPMLAEAQRIVEDELPVIPLGFTVDLAVRSDDVSNVVVDAGAMMRLELVEPQG